MKWKKSVATSGAARYGVIWMRISAPSANRKMLKPFSGLFNRINRFA
jgi:hypothetical protein